MTRYMTITMGNRLMVDPNSEKLNEVQNIDGFLFLSNGYINYVLS
jgi:hypothetical protein